MLFNCYQMVLFTQEPAFAPKTDLLKQIQNEIEILNVYLCLRLDHFYYSYSFKAFYFLNFWLEMKYNVKIFFYSSLPSESTI